MRSAARGTADSSRVRSSHSWSRFGLWLLLLFAFGPWIEAQESAKSGEDQQSWQIVRREWVKIVDVDAAFHLSNPWGDIRIRGGKGNEIRISAVTQFAGPNPIEDLNWSSSQQGLTAEIGFRQGFDPASQENFRIDLGIYLPSDLRAIVQTDDGALEAKGVDAHLRLQTNGGALDVRSHGSVDIRSRSGAVYAQLRRSDWQRPVAIETLTGDIRVDLLEGARANATVETRGSITTDYSMVIDRSPGSDLKQGLAEIGGGGQELRLLSNRGAIRLRALIVPQKPVPPKPETQ